MLKIDGAKHLEKLEQDFDNAIIRLNELYQYKQLGEIIDIAVNWYETGDTTYYSFFSRAFRCESALDFYSGLSSFLANCILDDSYYKVMWESYDTEDGGMKEGEPWKDYPYVMWADDKDGTNKEDLMLKAMKYCIKRNKEREEYYEGAYLKE